MRKMNIIYDGTPKSVESAERRVTDFVFLCLFLGNDYLPSQEWKGLELLGTMLNHYHGHAGVYLTDFDQILENNVNSLFLEVAAVELAQTRLASPETLQKSRDKLYGGGRDRDDVLNSYWNAIRCNWEQVTRGHGRWRWSYFMKNAPFIADLAEKLVTGVAWDAGDGEEVTQLMHLMMALPHQCFGLKPPVIPATYAEFRNEFGTLFGDNIQGENTHKFDAHAMLMQWGEKQLTDEERARNEPSPPTFFPNGYAGRSVSAASEPYKFLRSTYTRNMWRPSLRDAL